MTRIYVASSWRNEYYPEVVQKLWDCGFDVYDLRNPPSGDEGFHWCNVRDKWLDWTPEEYRDNLMHPLAERQFGNDIKAMESCGYLRTCPSLWSLRTYRGWLVCRKGQKGHCLYSYQIRTRTHVQTV